MTVNDFDQTARLWLEDGPTELSDRALQAALDEIHFTRQRRAWWPAWRFPRVTDAMRIAAVVGAVVFAVVGFGLLSVGDGPGEPAATPTPTPRALTVDRAQVGPGTYITADPFRLRVTFTLPDGWESSMGGPYFVSIGRPFRPGGVAFSIFEKVYADPCHPGQGLIDPQPGPTVADLATALAGRPGLDPTTPTDVTVDGYAGKQLTLTAPASFDGCTISESGYVIWELPLGGTRALSPSEREQVWILDVEGERLVIGVADTPDQTPQEQAEVQAILDSIRIAPLD